MVSEKTEFELESVKVGRQIYGPRTMLPPGAVPAERHLARFVVPGATRTPHGIPPIGSVCLPDGWIMPDFFDDEAEKIDVLPCRLPWYSRAYALRLGTGLIVLRNVHAMELGTGMWVTVQFNDARDWTARFGRVTEMTTTTFKLVTPEGEAVPVSFGEIHFVGKVIFLWSESAVAAA